LVAEADESDASFLHLTPMMSVVTNIDHDHMDTYQGDYHYLERSFIDFVHRLPFYGVAIVCLEDANVKAMMPKLSRKIRTYGFDPIADIQAASVVSMGLQTRFWVKALDLAPFEVTLNQPGRHNVLNALAAIGVALELNVSVSAIQTALLEFGGVARRFEVYPNLTTQNTQHTEPPQDHQSVPFTLIDDYGHHPTELEATLATARQAFEKKRLVLVFQPHRYSRTRDLFDEFVTVLMRADLVVVMGVYTAGEAPLPAFDSKALLQAMRLRGHKENVFVGDAEQLACILPTLLNPEDVVLMMGAGDIGHTARQWAQKGGNPPEIDDKESSA
jgi:UDP-N-acetylmuramate--alanine ligase